MTDFDKKYEIYGIVLLVAWIVYCMAVLLKTGFMGDDAYNCQIKGALLQQGVSLHDRIFSEIEGWIKGAGRFLIFGWVMTYGIYYLTQDTIVIKAINITIIVMGILLFYVFSKRETGSIKLSLLACMMIPVFFQFRLWHDPILSFTFLLPVCFALIMGALILFQRYLDQGQWVNYVGAICLYLVVLLTYEISIPLCLLFFAVVFFHSHDVMKSIKKSLPFTGLATLIIVASEAIKWSIVNSGFRQSTYPGAELHYHLSPFLSAFEIQTFSSVPLSYYVFGKGNLGSVLYSFDYVVLAIFFIALSMLIYSIGKDNLVPKLAGWMVCGSILLFLPAVLTSLSGHQVELNKAGLGFGYITVYVQYFGLCVFSVVLLTLVVKKMKARWFVFFVLMLSAGMTWVAALNLGLNRAVALKSNETYQYPRQLLKSALEAGLVDDLQDGSFLFHIMRFPSDYTWSYSTITGKKFEMCELNAQSDIKGIYPAGSYNSCIDKMIKPLPKVKYQPSIEQQKSFDVLDLSGKSAWIISYNFEKKSGSDGRVLLGKIDHLIRSIHGKRLLRIVVSEMRSYNLKQNKVRNVNLEGDSLDFLKVIANQTVDFSKLPLFDKGEFLVNNDIVVDWSGGIYAREGSDLANLRWSSGRAVLNLFNMSEESKRINLSMELGSPVNAASKLVVQYLNQSDTFTLKDQIRQRYSKSLLLPPGKTKVTFMSNGKPIQNGDPRNIVFGVFNFKSTMPAHLK